MHKGTKKGGGKRGEAIVYKVKSNFGQREGSDGSISRKKGKGRESGKPEIGTGGRHFKGEKIGLGGPY